MNRHENAFAKQNDLLEALSRRISKQLAEAIDEKGRASLIVSGGSTPKALFERLRKSSIQWEKVSVGLCDERWVESENEDSNERLVKNYLLQEKAIKAKFVGMYMKGQSAQAAEAECAQRIKEELWPFDVVVLGMGNDAHTASLFPHNVKLKEAFDLNSPKLCIAIEPQSAPHMRMSLTRKAILSAKHLYLHFEGEEKRAVYEKAIAADDMYLMPICSILHQDICDVEVYFS